MPNLLASVSPTEEAHCSSYTAWETQALDSGLWILLQKPDLYKPGLAGLSVATSQPLKPCLPGISNLAKGSHSQPSSTHMLLLPQAESRNEALALIPAAPALKSV